MEIEGGLCPKCYTVAPSGRKPSARRSQILTTETATELPIIARLGLVTGECAMGIDIFKDIGAGLRDIVGGRSKSLEASVAECRKAAIADLRDAADSLGADAVVALSIQVQELAGGGKSMLLVTATGTAVKLAADA